MQTLRVRNWHFEMSWPPRETRPRLTILDTNIRQGFYTDVSRGDLRELARWLATAAEVGLVDPQSNELRAVPEEPVR